MDSLTRIGISTPSAGRTDTADVPRDVRAIAVWADANAVFFGQGTFAARPTSTGGSPGKQGRIYMATDLTPHVLYYDFGTGWDPVGSVAAGSIGTTQLADGSVTGGTAGAGVKIAANTITAANIASGTVTTTEIANGTIVAADLQASTLSPAGGAGAGTETLRALGTAAGTAAAGTHASQHSRTGADPLVISTFISAGTFASRPSSGLVAGQLYMATDTGVMYGYNGSTWDVWGASTLMSFSQQTGSYTLVLADAGKQVEIANASANTLTVPPNSSVAFPVGTQIVVVQTGAGQMTITPGAGVTINAAPGLKTAAQWAGATLIKRATDTWWASGNLVP